MIEDYANYELSQALKAAGYNEPCDHFWYKVYTDSDEMEMRQASADDFNNDDWDVPHCSAPHIYHAQKWLREIHHIDINIDLDDETDEPYTAEIYKDKKCVVGHWELRFFATYEQALSAGLLAALKLINNKL